MIVWLASYPRSGNTFLRILLSNFFDQKTYSKYNDILDIGKDDSFSRDVGHLRYEGKWKEFYESANDSEDPVFIKTHDKPEDDAKAIFILRDGRASAVSYWQYLRKHSKLEIDLQEVIAGSVAFGSWPNFMDAWKPKTRKNTLIVRYENLVSDPMVEIKRIGEFIGMTPEKGSLPNFEDLKEKHPNFFRVGNNQDNLDIIGDDDEAWIMSNFGPKLLEFGYVDKVEFDSGVAQKIAERLQQKTLKIKRELEAANDENLTSRVEARVHALQVSLAKDIDELQTAMSTINPSIQGQLEPYEQQIKALADLSKATQDSVTELKLHQENMFLKSQYETESNIESKLKSTESSIGTKLKSTETNIENKLRDAENSLDSKLKDVQGPLHAKLEALSDLTQATQATLIKNRLSLEKQDKSSQLKVSKMLSSLDEKLEPLSGISQGLTETSVDIQKNLAATSGDIQKNLSDTSDDINQRLSDLKTEQKKLLRQTQTDIVSGQKSLIRGVQGDIAVLRNRLTTIMRQLEDQDEAKARNDKLEKQSKVIFDKTNQISNSVQSLKESRADRENLISLSRSYINELEQKNKFLADYIVEYRGKAERNDKQLARFRNGMRRISAEYDELLAKVYEYEWVLAPRFKSLMEMRPIRYILKTRKQVKEAGGAAETLQVMDATEILSNNGIYDLDEPHVGLSGQQSISELIPGYAAVGANPNAADAEGASAVGLVSHALTHSSEKQPLGIAVYTFDRKDLVHNVLESLAQQGQIGNVHVFIDGDQGNPNRRKVIDKTEELVRQYDVKDVHRNRGNFGFRKMMLTSQRYMLERYEKIIFLEDDCFPTHNAVEEFSRELDNIKNDSTIFSVYGHPFLMPGEDEPFGRFQGWGWATTAEKLEPIWRQLMDIYLLTEHEYLEFVKNNLTKDLIKRIDITPGRQPTSTIKNFFAWDETLCMLTGMGNMNHKRSDQRLIYNCGVGESSAHFTKIDYYRKPPFNMVAPSQVWDYF